MLMLYWKSLYLQDPALGPNPIIAPEPKTFEILNGDVTQQAMTTILPEEIIVDILTEKLLVCLYKF